MIKSRVLEMIEITRIINRPVALELQKSRYFTSKR